MGETTNKMKNSKLITILLWLVGIIIGALVIAAITKTEAGTEANTLCIVVIVLLALMALVSLVSGIMSKSQDNYEVNKDAEKGKENTAFDGEESKRNGTENQQQNGSSSSQQAGTGDEKWVSNYVPFGDYPKGNTVQ